MRLIRYLSLLVAGATVGTGAGLCTGGVASMDRDPSPAVRAYKPLPHRVPKSPNAASFRFAMVHDVLHERYPKHGSAHYTERNRIVRGRLAKLSPDDPATFPLIDDLTVGLARLGKLDEAIPLLRDKLARQLKQGKAGRDLYSTYANLGAIQFHYHLDRAIAGDKPAAALAREGLGLLNQSVAVNPDSHFGREQWQVVLAEFLLAATERPDLLKAFDCVGNRLGTPARDLNDAYRMHDELGRLPGYGRAYVWETYFWHWPDQTPGVETIAEDMADEPPEDAPQRAEWWNRVNWYRKHVTQVGAEKGWTDVSVQSHRAPVAFDEPVLGVIGMWRQGIGASPHFSLMIGETMLRVGQRFIAWSAYERASRLAATYWRDPNLQQFLRDHCAQRQREIEETLKPAEVADLRPRFDEEFVYGTQYQRDYQAHEAAKLANGADVFDERLHDDFHRDRKHVASAPGSEEWFAIADQSKKGLRDVWRAVSLAVLGAGLGAALVAGVISLRPRPNSPPAAVTSWRD